MNISQNQIEIMKHAIGWDAIDLKHKTLNAYRNRYVVRKDTSKYLELKDLESKQLVKELPNFDVSMSLFQVTTKAVKFLSNKYQVKIIQDKEDIIEVNNE